MHFSEVYSFQSVVSAQAQVLKVYSESITRTLHDVSFPDNGGGFGYSYDSGGKRCNRFIIWRSYGETLELCETSLDDRIANNVLKVLFSGSAIVDCKIVDTPTSVECLVCTSNGASRLSFLRPQREDASRQCSIFCSGQYTHKFHQLKGLQPSTIRSATSCVCNFTGDALFAYGTSTGSVMIARINVDTPENVEVCELHQTSVIQKLWSGITPFSTKTEADSPASAMSIIFVHLHADDYIIASICKDHRVRLWDIKNRCCFMVLDLLESLSEKGILAMGFASMHSQFAPGMYHRIAGYPVQMAGVEDTLIQGLLIYLSLSPSSPLDADRAESISGSNSGSMNYWCWTHLDVQKARQRDRESLKIISFEPIVPPQESYMADSWPSELREGSLLQGDSVKETGAFDFLPVHSSHPPKWGAWSNKGSSPSAKGSARPTRPSAIEGVWWIAHQTDSQSTDLDSRYSVRWTSASPHSNTTNFVAHLSCAPPGCTPYECNGPLKRQMPGFLTRSKDFTIQSTTDPGSRWDANELEEFLDFVFEPSRFSWFAIASALKSVHENSQIGTGAPLQFVGNVDELRAQVRRTLSEELTSDMELTDVHNLLKTFYSTAVDYHDYGLQPLGLFEIPFGTGLLPLDRGYVPYAPGVVVVRRWGFSVLRPLDAFERLLWNQRPKCPLYVDMDADLEKNDDSLLADAVVKLTTHSHLLSQQLSQHRLWPDWQRDLFASCLSTSSRQGDPVDPVTLANNVLDELIEKDSSWIRAPISDPNDWKQQLLTDELDELLLTAFDRITAFLESPDYPLGCDFDFADHGDSQLISVRNGEVKRECPHKGLNTMLAPTHTSLVYPSSLSSAVSLQCSNGPPVGIELLTQAFTQSVHLRTQFAFALLLLLVRHQINPAGVESVLVGGTLITCDSVCSRLSDLIHCLRVMHWLGCIRMPALPDSTSLKNTWEHLNLLGMSSLPGEGHSLEMSYLADLLSTQIAGMTLLEQLCADWSPLETSYLLKRVRDAQLLAPWGVRCHIWLSNLFRLFNPNKRSGTGLVRIFQCLLISSRSLELLALCNLLCPPQPLNVSAVLKDEIAPSDARWWNGDYSLVHLCCGLARLWVGQSEMAKNEFIKASDWLRGFLQASLSVWRVGGSAGLFEHQTVPSVRQLLISTIFPKELSISKLLCVRDTDQLESGSICPDEAQIRFLMKIMPILESMDCVREVLDIAEFALNRLAKVEFPVDKTYPEEEDEHELEPWSQRLAFVMANLYSLHEGQDEGFLCDPNPREDILNGKSQNCALYTRLADLEAALWTRIFKHQLALGHYAQAHMLIRSNPDSARRRDCLRQLIVTLCDRGEASRLINFHYGSSEDEFLHILEARARATDVLPASSADLESPSFCATNPYYHVLYAFHIRRANYRAAAIIMFEYAHRLAEETACSLSSLSGSGFRAGGARLLLGLQRQAACLLTAINALYLVPEEHQWLIRPGTGFSDESSLFELGDTTGAPKHYSQDAVKLELLSDGDWAFADVDSEVSSESSPMDIGETDKDYNCPTKGITNTYREADQRVHDIVCRTTRMAYDKQILQLKDILRLYILIRARLRLAQTCWEKGMLRAGPSTPQETVQSLLSVALYDEAITVSEKFDLDFVPVVSALSTRCSELAQHASNTVVPMTAPLNPGAPRFPSLLQPAVLPGLVDVPSPIRREAELVLQSINSLRASFSSGRIKETNWEGSCSADSPDLSAPDLRLSELYWHLLEVVLTRLDPPYISTSLSSRVCRQSLGGGQLHLLACERILESGPNRLNLPGWLVSRMLNSSARTARPVGLLRLYFRFDRIEAAYRLIMDMLDAAIGICADPSAFGIKSNLIAEEHPKAINLLKTGLQSPKPVWIPHNLLVHLLEGLRQLGAKTSACKIMYENLSNKMREYFSRLEAVCSQISPASVPVESV
ncbi:unnamed protein product [Calicophoron daubneyi]|uniref:Nuclear pore complex protein Nup160 n=1 Tax=Calicophoron daubneyi TaxID=300641 RepID=A0AAV2TQE8_CALDB